MSGAKFNLRGKLTLTGTKCDERRCGAMRWDEGAACMRLQSATTPLWTQIGGG